MQLESKAASLLVRFLYSESCERIQGYINLLADVQCQEPITQQEGVLTSAWMLIRSVVE